MQTVEVPALYLALVPAVSALAGAAIPAFFSFLAMRSQQQSEERRLRARLVLRAALHDYDKAIHPEALDMLNRPPPLSAYILHHETILQLAEKGSLTATKVAELEKQLGELKQFSRKR